MTDVLFVQLPTHGEPDGVRWSLFQADGVHLGSGQETSLDGVRLMLEQNSLDDCQIHVLVDGTDVVMKQAVVPTKQARYVRQAIPFAIEDDLAIDIDDVHLAIGERNGGEYPVAVVTHECMTQWLAQLSDQELDAHALYADHQLLPWQQGEWTLALEGEHAWLRLSATHSVSLHRDNIMIYLEAYGAGLGEDTEAAITLKVYGREEYLEAANIVLAQLEQLERPPLTIEREPLKVSISELLAQQYFTEAPAFQLLQGEYKITRKSQSALRKWLPVAALAATWFVVQVTIDVVKTQHYEAEADRHFAETKALYQSIFPDTRRVSRGSLRRQLEGKLRAAKAGGGQFGFIKLFGDAGYHLTLLADKNGLEYNAVNYNEQRGELVVDIAARSIEQINSYRQALADAGYNVEIASAVSEEAGVRGRLAIRGS